MTWPIVATIAILAVWSLIMAHIQARRQIDALRAKIAIGAGLEHQPNADFLGCTCGERFTGDYYDERFRRYRNHLIEMNNDA